MILKSVRTQVAGVKMKLSKNKLNQLHYRVLRGTESIKEYSDLWDNLNDTEKMNYLRKNIKLLYKYGTLDYLLEHSSPDINKKVFDYAVNVFPSKDLDYVASSFKGISIDNVSKISNMDKLVQVMRGVGELQFDASNDDEKQKYNNVVKKIRNNTEYEDSYLDIWNNLPDEIKESNPEMMDSILGQALAGNLGIRGKDVPDIWYTATEEYQKKNKSVFKSIAQIKNVNIADLWQVTKAEAQKGLVDELFDDLKKKPEQVGEVWKVTDKSIQNSKRIDFIDKYADAPAALLRLWFADDVAFNDDRYRNYIEDKLANSKDTKATAKSLGCKKDEIKDRINRIIEYGKDNRELVNADLRILDDRVLSMLGKDDKSKKSKINLLTKNPNLAEKFGRITELRDCDARLSLLSGCLDGKKDDEWLDLATKITDGMPKYRNLVKSFKDTLVTEEQKKKLIQLFSMDDQKFKVNNLEDLDNLNDIIKKKCDRDIKSLSIDKNKNAVLMNNFGITLKEANDILANAKENMSSLKNGNIDLNTNGIMSDNSRAFVEILKNICETKDKAMLKELYSSGNVYDRDTTFKSKDEMNKQIKSKKNKVVERNVGNLVDITKIPEKDGVREIKGEFNVVLARARDYDKKGDAKATLRNNFSIGSKEPEDFSANYGSDIFFGFDKPSSSIDGETQETTLDKSKDKPKYIVVYRQNGKVPDDVMKEAKRLSSKNAKPREKAGKHTMKPSYVYDPKTGKPFMDNMPIVVIDYDTCREENRLYIPKTSPDQIKELAESGRVKKDELKNSMKIIKKMRDRSRGIRAMYDKVRGVKEFEDESR